MTQNKKTVLDKEICLSCYSDFIVKKKQYLESSGIITIKEPGHIMIVSAVVSGIYNMKDITDVIIKHVGQSDEPFLNDDGCDMDKIIINTGKLNIFTCGDINPGTQKILQVIYITKETNHVVDEKTDYHDEETIRDCIRNVREPIKARAYYCDYVNDDKYVCCNEIVIGGEYFGDSYKKSCKKSCKKSYKKSCKKSYKKGYKKIKESANGSKKCEAYLGDCEDNHKKKKERREGKKGPKNCEVDLSDCVDNHKKRDKKKKESEKGPKNCEVDLSDCVDNLKKSDKKREKCEKCRKKCEDKLEMSDKKRAQCEKCRKKCEDKLEECETNLNKTHKQLKRANKKLKQCEHKLKHCKNDNKKHCCGCKSNMLLFPLYPIRGPFMYNAPTKCGC